MLIYRDIILTGFDIPLLMEEFFYGTGIELDMTNRRMLDVQTIFHMMEKRTLEAAYKFYCKKDLVDAHSAEEPMLLQREILEAQLEKYANLGNTVDTVLQFTGEEKYVDFARRICIGKRRRSF